MAKLKNIEFEDGVLVSPMNTETREFQEFQLFISQKAANLNKKQKLQVELFALQIKIKDYSDDLKSL